MSRSTASDDREGLETMVRERTATLWEAVQELQQIRYELLLAQDETIHSLCVAAEFRDYETSSHIERVSRYSKIIAEAINLDSERCRLIGLASKMHDIGKIGVSDAILLKRKALTTDEIQALRAHTEMGYDILRACTSELAEVAGIIAWTHHEWVDGSGYPRGLKDKAIPIEGRIVAIADVFDALSTDRTYRKTYSLPDALGILLESRTVHLDPVLVDAFLGNMDQVIPVIEQFP